MYLRKKFLRILSSPVANQCSSSFHSSQSFPNYSQERVRINVLIDFCWLKASHTTNFIHVVQPGVHILSADRRIRANWIFIDRFDQIVLQTECDQFPFVDVIVSWARSLAQCSKIYRMCHERINLKDFVQ